MRLFVFHAGWNGPAALKVCPVLQTAARVREVFTIGLGLAEWGGVDDDFALEQPEDTDMTLAASPHCCQFQKF